MTEKSPRVPGGRVEGPTKDEYIAIELVAEEPWNEKKPPEPPVTTDHSAEVRAPPAPAQFPVLRKVNVDSGLIGAHAPATTGLFAEDVRSNETPSHTTTKFENVVAAAS